MGESLLEIYKASSAANSVKNGTLYFCIRGFARVSVGAIVGCSSLQLIPSLGATTSQQGLVYFVMARIIAPLAS